MIELRLMLTAFFQIQGTHIKKNLRKGSKFEKGEKKRSKARSSGSDICKQLLLLLSIFINGSRSILIEGEVANFSVYSL